MKKKLYKLTVTSAYNNEVIWIYCIEEELESKLKESKNLLKQSPISITMNNFSCTEYNLDKINTFKLSEFSDMTLDMFFNVIFPLINK